MNKFNSLHDSIFKRVVKKVFNVKFFLTMATTIAFGFLLRYFYTQVLELGISFEKLDVANLSFCFLIALFRNLSTILLDEFFPSYLYSDNQYVKTKQSTAFLMEGSSSKSTPPSVDEILGFSKQASNTLSEAYYTLREMEKLKHSAGVRVIETKDGGLDIDVAGDMSDQKAKEISDKIFNLEAKYNNKIEQYKELLKQADKSNYRSLSHDYRKMYQNVLDQRARVYEKES